MVRVGARQAVGRVVVSCAIGAAFGAATSFVNWLSTPESAGGGTFADTAWGSMLRVVSHMFDSGWAWAAVAVVAGWWAGTIAWGVLAGPLSLLAATAGYDLANSVQMTGPFTADLGDMPLWGAVSLLAGPLLGAVGACIRIPGVVGLVASLVVPAGAALQMMVLPPGVIELDRLPPPLDDRQMEAAWARATVLAAAALAAVYLIACHTLSRHRTRAGPGAI